MKTNKRVIVKWKASGQDRYAAGIIEGIEDAAIVIRLPAGLHYFSRSDGTWVEGPCANYVDAIVQDIADVDASIRAGHGGDVVAYKASLPVDVAAPAQA